jgi:hypothetical protein
MKGHRTKKVLLARRTFYIKNTRTRQARFEPSLPKSLLPEELEVEDLLGKERPFVEWSPYFSGLLVAKEAKSQSLMLYGNSSPGSWEKIEAPLLHNFAIANRSLRTPKRLRLGEMQAVDQETLPMMGDRADQFSVREGYKLREEGDVLQAKIQSGLKTVFAKWNRLKATFDVIHLKFNDTATGEQKYWEAVQKTMLDMQESIRQADSRIQLMHAAIGYDFEASEEGTISVWQAIAGVKKELSKVKADA